MPSATKANDMYLPMRLRRNGSSTATMAISSATTKSVARVSVGRRMSFIASAPGLGREQAVGPEVEHYDHQQQDGHARHRSAHEVLQRGLRLRDGKARESRADQTLHAAEDDNDERVDDVELAR